CCTNESEHLESTDAVFEAHPKCSSQRDGANHDRKIGCNRSRKSRDDYLRAIPAPIAHFARRKIGNETRQNQPLECKRSMQDQPGQIDRRQSKHHPGRQDLQRVVKEQPACKLEGKIELKYEASK